MGACGVVPCVPPEARGISGVEGMSGNDLEGC